MACKRAPFANCDSCDYCAGNGGGVAAGWGEGGGGCRGVELCHVIHVVCLCVGVCSCRCFCVWVCSVEID